MSKLETIGSILPMQNTTYSWFTFTYHSRSDWRLREKKEKQVIMLMSPKTSNETDTLN